MKLTLNPLLYLFAAAIFLTGCENLDRSRDIANPNVTGKTLALQVCATCHGVTGNSISPFFPKLAAQQPEYLVDQIKNFRSHQRAVAVAVQHMWGLALNLTDDQIKEIADYYSSQVSVPIKVGTNPEQMALGKSIYDNGLTEKGTPPCIACHGPNGQGMGAFPRLAYQHADYIEKQLKVFQETDDRPGTPMKQVSHPLTKEEMQAVAEYLQSFPSSK